MAPASPKMKGLQELTMYSLPDSVLFFDIKQLILSLSQIPNMRLTGIILVLLTAFISCKKEERVTDTSAPCLTVTDRDPAYEYEELNRSYSIAFLPSYIYGGYIVFEGDYFIKKKITGTDTITFNAAYGPSSGQKSVYGPPLVNTAATQVDIEYKNKIFTLKNKKRLCTEGTIGYYYYTLEKEDPAGKNKGLGVVYLLDGTDFRQNLIVDFPAETEFEISTIIASIKKKD